MFFGKPKPTVTPEDKDWIDEAFLWFEQEYGHDYLKSVRTIEPTKEFFPIDFKGTYQNAEDLVKIICKHMFIKNAEIKLNFFSDKPIELAEGIVIAQQQTGFGYQNKNKLGTYSERGRGKYVIEVELDLLKNPMNLIATLAHELSHLVLLGEGRLQQNDEELTDLNCIALGFGIFSCNSIFNFQQWTGSSHQGWQAKTSGYIPEQVATYALALMTNYQGNDYRKWIDYLNTSPKKMFKKNMQYLTETKDEIKFK